MKKNKWEKLDDDMICNEDQKQVVTWCTYGDDNEYFLSEYYEFDTDFLEPIEETRDILINEKIDKNDTLRKLIKRTKERVL